MKRLAVPSLKRGDSGDTSEREGSNPSPLHHPEAKTYFASMSLGSWPSKE